MSENRQIWVIHKRESIGAEYRQALSITDAHIGDRGARIRFHQATIRIFKRRNTDGTSSLNRRWGEWVGIGRGLNKHWPACAAVLRVRSAMPIFNTAINVQHRPIAPGWVARFGR